MSHKARLYPSTTHTDLVGSGWWGAPWGHNLPDIVERVPGHGCASCCSNLNQCQPCAQAIDGAAMVGGNEYSAHFCEHHWHHFQIEAGCQCSRCRTQRDQHGAQQAEEADLKPMRRYAAFVNRLAELPPSERTLQRVREVAAEMGMERTFPDLPEEEQPE